MLTLFFITRKSLMRPYVWVSLIGRHKSSNLKMHGSVACNYYWWWWWQPPFSLLAPFGGGSMSLDTGLYVCSSLRAHWVWAYYETRKLSLFENRVVVYHFLPFSGWHQSKWEFLLFVHFVTVSIPIMSAFSLVGRAGQKDALLVARDLCERPDQHLAIRRCFCSYSLHSQQKEVSLRLG